ncbi:MAG: DUF4178 domain-containing protein [Flavobacterium sp.]|nr:DUF4178 domain-containing protein [Flavobacterium sp.]
MDITCTNCNTKVSLSFNLDYKYYTCFSCKSNFKLDNGNLKYIDKLLDESYPPSIKIGSKGVLRGEEYTVVNFVYKKNNKKVYWFEYQLISSTNKELFLTVEDGHWILEEKIDSKYIKNKFGLFYKDIEYKKYETGKSQEFYRCGFFDYKFDNSLTFYEEYINPPFCISIENEDNEKQYFHGEHINSKVINKIFDIKNPIMKDGVGLVQPFYYNLTQVFIIFICAIIGITGLHIFFYSQSKEQLVYQDSFDLNQVNNKEIYSNVFQLNGPIAPLSIDITSSVDNSWMTTDFALINQKTNETVYFTKDLEFYYGYSEGENWTEGSQNDEFNICGVSEGAYKNYDFT